MMIERHVRTFDAYPVDISKKWRVSLHMCDRTFAHRLPQVDAEWEEGMYKVRRILDHRRVRGGMIEYEVEGCLAC